MKPTPNYIMIRSVTMSRVSLEVKDYVAVIDLHSEPLNVFNMELLQELNATLAEVDLRDDVRVVMIKSSMRIFSGGADLSLINGLSKADTQAQKDALLKNVTDVATGVYNCRFPVVSAVHSKVVGLGVVITFCSDICIASDDATFSVPEVTAGWIGASEFVQLSIPRRLARYYVYTGKPMPAQELRSYGGVLDVVPREKLEERAMEVCKELVNMPPLAVQYFKACMNHNDDERLLEKYLYEYQYTLRYMETEDFAESIDAFFSKRRPQFKGR